MTLFGLSFFIKSSSKSLKSVKISDKTIFWKNRIKYVCPLDSENMTNVDNHIAHSYQNIGWKQLFRFMKSSIFVHFIQRVLFNAFTILPKIAKILGENSFFIHGTRYFRPLDSEKFTFNIVHYVA